MDEKDKIKKALGKLSAIGLEAYEQQNLVKCAVITMCCQRLLKRYAELNNGENPDGSSAYELIEQGNKALRSVGFGDEGDTDRSIH